ncbi:Uncharacterized protein ACMD2_01238 [Ananas comosus]|uniref:Pentatricopeptide repeat (PPR) superfamily protein n=1 Tax=Ananas comosus TaxID=4615 RepID=A0A199VA45_ANACO|nr:Uncharacterized protein ACMD2_01238 [Ananas comosus]
MSTTTAASWIKSPFDGWKNTDFSSISFRCRSPFGACHSYSLANGQDLSLSKVRVAADYSDSLPDSSKYAGNQGYHPLEEVKKQEKNKDMLLTDAETARTIVESNGKALILFPGRVHCEPHGHVTWSEFHFVVDDYGDIFFELLDDGNLLQDPNANNPVAVLIGMDIPISGENRIFNSDFDDYMDDDSVMDILFDDYDEVDDTDITDVLIKWGMPDTLRRIHPRYFARCLTKAVNSKHGKKMDRPSNGLSIMGCLRPAFVDEESYLRRLFHHDDDGYLSDWRDGYEREEEEVARSYDFTGGERWRFIPKGGRSSINSTIYKLEIMTMELLSSMIDLQEFQDAEPDVLANSASAIIERFNEYGTQCNTALKALCRRRKGLTVERAKLIGVDSLGMDVRVFSGMEAQTLRFSFNARAMSESVAEKKIKRMLFPRYHRKNLKAPRDDLREF